MPAAWLDLRYDVMLNKFLAKMPRNKTVMVVVRVKGMQSCEMTGVVNSMPEHFLIVMPCWLATQPPPPSSAYSTASEFACTGLLLLVNIYCKSEPKKF
jgi:hypothetical protein